MEFHRDFYITEIKTLLFRLPHVRNLGMYHCGNISQEAFKLRSDLQEGLRRCDYIERVESFKIHMGFPFPFLRAKNLRLSLLNIISRSFLLSCT